MAGVGKSGIEKAKKETLQSEILVDSVQVSVYNDFKVIYLWGVAFRFYGHKGGMAVDRPSDTEIKNALKAADTEAQYDDRAKRLLGNKIILAHILVKTVDEFHGMNPEDVVPYIEGDPFISAIPVEPGLTNAVKEGHGQRVVGFNTENTEINEGLVRFDIVFYVRMKDGISQIIVNLEAQKNMPTEYHILNRAIFYVSRMVSSQKERDFVNTDYNDIKRVFSIWVCLDTDQNSMNYIHLTNDGLIGSCEWEGKLDLLNIVLIGLSKELPGHEEQYELHRLLGTLLSKKLSVKEKLDIMEKEYHIPIEDKIRKDVSVMCNLSQGIKDDINTKVIMNMHRKGYPSDQIAEIVEISIDEVEAVIKKENPVLV